ncbi:hypothetical protein [Noviherbaspirillum sp. ST9]|uniref:hypothetical protein n=1 Tax=Noviherbaspirillum sp. ST9 TaxID=3401606 RepID=UPI003B588B2B
MDQRPIPVVGPPIPGPLGDPLEPLPIEPLPGEVGLVPGLVPEAPRPLPPALLPDVGGQSPLDDLLPAVAPVQSDPLLDGAPALESPVDPPLPDAEGVFGSTELPEPSVPALVPEVEGVAVCADAIPAVSSSEASNINFFMVPPEKSIERIFCKEHA